MRVVETSLSFGDATDRIKSKIRPLGMRLPQWSEEVVILVQEPDPKSKMTAPYFYVSSRFGKVCWIPTMIEMFNNNWILVEGDEGSIDLKI